MKRRSHWLGFDHLRRRKARWKRERKARRRAEAIDRLGGRCVGPDCGAREHLEFHHRDPAEKQYRIGDIWTLCAEKFWREILKCDLLCCDCHSEFHRAERERREAGEPPF